MPILSKQAQAGRALPWRSIITWVFILLFVWLVWNRFGDIDALLTTLRSGKPVWIGAAVAGQLLYFVLFAGIYWSAFRVVDVQMEMPKLIPLTYASIFVNTTVTSGGAAGTVLFVDEARRRGESTARATVGTILVIATDFSAFSVLLTIGMISLIRHHEITKLETVTALAMYLMIFGTMALLTTGLWAPNWLRRAFITVHGLERRVSKLLRRPRSLLSDDWPERNADEFTTAAQAIVQHPVQVLRTIGIAMVAHLVDLFTLFALFLAFSQPTTLSILIILYAMSIVFRVASPTPNGIGIVETVLPAIYVSVGVPLEVGTVINLAFRGVSFWIPLVVGVFSLHRVNRNVE
jgi:uncharacterized protein (TIRG00374 family)